jgi:hypothetical protein
VLHPQGLHRQLEHVAAARRQGPVCRKSGDQVKRLRVPEKVEPVCLEVLDQLSGAPLPHAHRQDGDLVVPAERLEMKLQGFGRVLLADRRH